VDEIEIHVFRVQSLEGVVQGLGHEIGRGGSGLGRQEDVLANLRVATEKTAETFFALAVAVPFGRVPVSDPPLVCLLQQELVVDGVQHPAQGEDGNLHPGFPQFAPGYGLRPGRGGFSLDWGGSVRRGRGPDQGAESQGLDEATAG